jgi:hypothetical protein
MLYLTILSDLMNTSSVGVATGYGLDGRGSILSKGKTDFSPFHRIQHDMSLWSRYLAADSF